MVRNAFRRVVQPIEVGLFLDGRRRGSGGRGRREGVDLALLLLLVVDPNFVVIQAPRTRLVEIFSTEREITASVALWRCFGVGTGCRGQALKQLSSPL